MSNQSKLARQNHNPIRTTGQLLAVWRFDDQAARPYRIEAKAYDTSNVGGQTELFVLLDGALMREPIVLSAADARLVAGGLLAAADLLDGHAIRGTFK